MNNSFLKITAGIFLALLVAVGYPWIDGKLSTPESEQSSVPASVDFSGFDKQSVGKVVMKQKDSERILNYRDGKWYIGEEEADQLKVDQLFQAFAELEVKEMVSQNEENQERFGVSKEPVLQLAITQSGKEHVFFVGKVGPSVGDFYVRKSGIKNVYLVNGNMRDTLFLGASEWKPDEKEPK